MFAIKHLKTSNFLKNIFPKEKCFQKIYSFKRNRVQMLFQSHPINCEHKNHVSYFLCSILMMHENQQTKLLWATVMAVNPEKKERTAKSNWCDPAKDPPTIKSVFSLGHKERK